MIKPLTHFATSFIKEIHLPAGPTHIAVSGGRSSAALCKLILEHFGHWPKDYHAIFTNTGREHPATLEFVHEIETRWQIPITWLELASLTDGSAFTYKQVDHKTASRDGQPFNILLRAKPTHLPGRNSRTCTMYLKTLPPRQYLKDIGFEKMQICFGYRLDEAHRLNKSRSRCGRDKDAPYPYAPLIAAGIDKGGVLAFFAQNDFDLQLNSLLGNCVFCFMKSRNRLLLAARHEPEIFDEWIKSEEEINKLRAAKDFKPYYMLPEGYIGLKKQLVGDVAMYNKTDDDLTDLECGCTD